MTQVFEETLYCANHPNVETSLRCRSCEKPICAKCAVLTPTGYKCKECVRGQQKVFNTAVWYDYVLAFVIAGVLSYIGSLITGRLGWFIIFYRRLQAVSSPKRYGLPPKDGVRKPCFRSRQLPPPSVR